MISCADFFADSLNRIAFKHAILKYSGVLTDPVSRVRFTPSETSPHAVHRNRDYYFKNQKNYDRFMSYPDSFAVRYGA